MGKTTVLFNILEQFNDLARTAFLFQTHGDSRDFLRYLISELGDEAHHSDLVGMQEALNHLLIREHRAGRQTIIIIDEAQGLDTSALETVRLLSNFETPTEKLLQIILAGQPQLAQRLATPELAQLYQRVSIRTTLIPFDLEDTRNYIEHRLKITGYQGPPLFTAAAVRSIWERSGGVPREINTLCFNALLLATAVEQKQVDSEILREVVADLDLNPVPFNKDTPPRDVRDVQTADVVQLGDAAAHPPATIINKTCNATVPGAKAEADNACKQPTVSDGVELVQLGTIAVEIVPASRIEKPKWPAAPGAKAEAHDASAPPTALEGVDLVHLVSMVAEIGPASRRERTEQAAAWGKSSADLALDLMLNKIVDQARLATAASGAAIALSRDGEMVCRASVGDSAPGLGVRLNMRSGVSGACVQSKTVQRCDDAENDPRADAAACRNTEIRSILAVPILEGQELLGVLEVFAARTKAFDDADVYAVQALSRRIVENLRRADEVRDAKAESDDVIVRGALPDRTDLASNRKTDVVTRADTRVCGRPSCETEAAGNSTEVPPSTPEALDAPGANDATPPYQKWPFLTNRRWIGAIAALVIVSSFTLGLIIRRSLGRRSFERPSVSRTEAPDKPETVKIPEVVQGLTDKRYHTQSRGQQRTAGAQDARSPFRMPQQDQRTVDSTVHHIMTESSARETVVEEDPAPRTAVNKSSGQPPNVDDVPNPEDNITSVSGSLMSNVRAAGAEDRAANSTVPQITTESNADETVVDENPAPGMTVDKSFGKTANIVPARLIREVKPIYPPAALEAQIQGSVALQVIVDKNGAVHDVRFVRGPPILTPAAIDAVEHWRFRPSYLNGWPLESEMLVTVRFSLR
jgi:TonB family protein